MYKHFVFVGEMFYSSCAIRVFKWLFNEIGNVKDGSKALNYTISEATRDNIMI